MGINSESLQSLTKTEYTRTVDVIALGLLLHTATAQLSPRVGLVLAGLSRVFGISENTAAHENLTEIIGIILYALIFLLPAFFISKLAPVNNKKIGFSPILGKFYLFALIMTLGMVAISGQLTLNIQTLFRHIGIDFRSYSPYIPDDIFGIILVFISSSIVPAVVEEIFFRKVILERLLPYGINFAVLVSAAAFALMHTNPTQTLYPFAAGLFLGIITVKCGSVIPAITVHFANNTLSLIYVMIEKYANVSTANIIIFSTETLLVLSAAILFIIMSKKGWFILETERKSCGFSRTKTLFRVFTFAYIFYTVFLAMKWVYII